MKLGWFSVWVALLVSAAWAQPLRVYSEFAQIDQAGKIIAPAEPREILSPAIVRNGFTSFQVVVDVPPGTPYQLYVVQNPEKTVTVTLYKERANGLLDPVAQPVSGDSTQVFWMDLWTPRDAPVQRIKVEPQLYINNDWVIYPMEARAVSATADSASAAGGDTPPAQVMKSFLCDPAPVIDYGAIRGGFNVQGMRLRNALQDLTLAKRAPKAELQAVFGACRAPMAADPEWYLHIRDYLFRLR